MNRRRRRDDLWAWQCRQPSQTPLRDALRRAAGTGLASLIFVATLAVAPYVRTAWPHQRPAEQATVEESPGRAGEVVLEAVELATDAFRAVPAVPGVRPSFVPRRAVVVVDGTWVRLAPLDEALSGRAGRIVAWVP